MNLLHIISITVCNVLERSSLARFFPDVPSYLHRVSFPKEKKANGDAATLVRF